MTTRTAAKSAKVNAARIAQAAARIEEHEAAIAEQRALRNLERTLAAGRRIYAIEHSGR